MNGQMYLFQHFLINLQFCTPTLRIPILLVEIMVWVICLIVRLGYFKLGNLAYFDRYSTDC